MSGTTFGEIVRVLGLQGGKDIIECSEPCYKVLCDLRIQSGLRWSIAVASSNWLIDVEHIG